MEDPKDDTTVWLYPHEIVVDVPWQSRQSTDEQPPEAEKPDDLLSNKAFDESITKEVQQPPRVMRLPDGRWGLIFGFRRVAASLRVAPDRPILCTIKPPAASARQDDREARAANINENINRRNLKPWELADALYKYQRAHRPITEEEMSNELPLGRKYIRDLICIRKGLHPEIWALFKLWGTSMRVDYKDLLNIASLPQDAQLDAWKVKLEELSERKARHGNKVKPGKVKLLKYYSQLDKNEPLVGGLKISEEFRQGMLKFARVALGMESWPWPNKGGRTAR